MNKTAVITGGTRGIGKAISLKLARSGFEVMALYARNKAAAQALLDEATKDNLAIEVLKADITKPESLKELCEDIKSKTNNVDVLVHSAASGVHKGVEELTVKHLKWTMEVNVFAFHALMAELLPLLKAGSRVIGLTSSGGTKVIPYYAAVGTSKGAMESLFRHYAAELAPKQIAVNLVCPGLVETDAVEAFPEKEKRVHTAREQTPTGVLTTPAHVADLVEFLSTSQAAGQIIGQTFVIDGGKCIKS